MYRRLFVIRGAGRSVLGRLLGGNGRSLSGDSIGVANLTNYLADRRKLYAYILAFTAVDRAAYDTSSGI